MTLKFKHKKSLGQHFLKDKNIVRKMVELAELKEDEIVWEIGPGKGILTKELLKKNCEVNCFEIDQRLFPILKKKFSDQIKLFSEDILKIDWKKYFPSQKIKIVANLPYQITTPFLFKVVKNISHFQRVVVMIQKEVAERINAKPRTKDYGILSLKMQFYFNVKYGFTVKSHLFFPPPKVDSAVMILSPKKNLPEISDKDLFWQIVKISFRNRRKMLRRNFRYLFSKQEIVNIEAASGISLTARAEELTEIDFVRLYHSLFLKNVLVEHIHLIESTS